MERIKKTIQGIVDEIVYPDNAFYYVNLAQRDINLPLEKLKGILDISTDGALRKIINTEVRDALITNRLRYACTAYEQQIYNSEHKSRFDTALSRQSPETSGIESFKLASVEEKNIRALGEFSDLSKKELNDLIHTYFTEEKVRVFLREIAQNTGDSLVTPFNAKYTGEHFCGADGTTPYLETYIAREVGSPAYPSQEKKKVSDRMNEVLQAIGVNDQELHGLMKTLSDRGLEKEIWGDVISIFSVLKKFGEHQDSTYTLAGNYPLKHSSTLNLFRREIEWVKENSARDFPYSMAFDVLTSLDHLGELPDSEGIDRGYWFDLSNECPQVRTLKNKVSTLQDLERIAKSNYSGTKEEWESQVKTLEDHLRDLKIPITINRL